MTKDSASPGARIASRPAPERIYKHGVVTTTFQSCQSLAIGAASIGTRLSSGECRLKTTASLGMALHAAVLETERAFYAQVEGFNPDRCLSGAGRSLGQRADLRGGQCPALRSSLLRARRFRKARQIRRVAGE